MSSNDFIVELGTEELPPKALKAMQDAFHTSIISSLNDAKISLGSSKAFASPRRLAVLINDLSEQAPAQEIVNEGPPKKVALDKDGNFTRAAEAFAKKNGLSTEQLQFEETSKGEKLVHRFTQAGTKTEDVLADIVKTAIKSIPVPKNMRWGSLREEFSRPVQWLVMLYGEQVIESELFGLKSGKLSRGHRFHADDAIEIDTPSQYEDLMRDTGYVIADYEQRRSIIEQQILSQATTLNATAVMPEALLDEVCGLVEYPIALVGNFEERFLSVPKEALISSMIEHQKYFPVIAENGDLLPHFIFITNIDSSAPENVIDGNERVIRPRLADAAFFFETDLKHSLESRIPALDKVVFQTKLGSIGDKGRRIAQLAADIAKTLESDSTLAERAGLLCKTDLVSEMVLEFDDLQGIAGYYYALNDKESPMVANAIKEHYLPQQQGDPLPSDNTAIAVALADRIDTLIGIFGIGLKPAGSKDPFALRRATLGIIRIIQEKALGNLCLNQLFEKAAQQFGDKLSNTSILADAGQFINERYRAIYQEKAISIDCLIAVQAVSQGSANPYDIDLRVNAVASFKQLAEAEALASANKRVANILAKNADAIEANTINADLLTEDAEVALFKAINNVEDTVTTCIKQQDYTNALKTLAALRADVDAFFDNVMVMADDLALRNNRLALLSSLRNLFTLTADISELQF